MVCVMTGTEGQFKPVCVMLTSLKENADFRYDVRVYHKGIDETQKEILNRLFNAEVLEYKRDWKFCGRYTSLAFSKYECLSLLEKYDKVLWLDTDVIVEKPIGVLIAMKDELCASRDILSLRSSFLPEYRDSILEGTGFNTGVLLFGSSIKNPMMIKGWCERKTEEIGKYLNFAEQGILNLAWREFNIPINYVGREYNTPGAFSGDIDGAKILHFFGPKKPWKMKVSNKRAQARWEYWQSKFQERLTA